MQRVKLNSEVRALEDRKESLNKSMRELRYRMDDLQTDLVGKKNELTMLMKRRRVVHRNRDVVDLTLD